ncbi:MAG TPA: carboxypeptidase-like regulatory domain-containing protein, partial [Vicinamibacterales bacterium]|nr:carboxypeptidase-like regulatory domain-containing protein [Vicinamibacterales bacterium]
MSRQVVKLPLFAAALLIVLPGVAAAQSITGLVKDATGAVLPGVTVEAASPALIEKVHTAVTDDQGRYLVVDLRPGTYTVTFTLPGFNTIKREGIELTGSFTATINADMTVGQVAETVTVTGESPLVDVQNVQNQRVVTATVVSAIPTARTFQDIAA